MAVRESNVISNYIKSTSFRICSFCQHSEHRTTTEVVIDVLFTGALLVDYDDVKLLIL